MYPREIEEVLYEHPAVLEAAVVGIEHPEHGEEVGAAVALASRCRTSSVEELRDYVKERVAAYKYPRTSGWSTSCPRARPGKILKREVEVPTEDGAG